MVKGDIFGYWTIIGPINRIGYVAMIDCKCKCGALKKVNVDSIKRGLSKSCGCYRSVASRNSAKGRFKKPEERSKIFNFGVNDFEASVKSGDKLVTSIYMKWYLMISRCYSKGAGKNWGNLDDYIDCTVCDQWSRFSNFLCWARELYFDGCELDKDLLVKDNKIYSPETCCFIRPEVNKFIRITKAGSYDKSLGKYRARCSNPFTGKNESLGLYSCESDAIKAWRKRKHEISCIYAGMQSDQRAAEALRLRYAD